MDKELYVVFVEEQHVDGYVYEYFIGVYEDLDKIEEAKNRFKRIFDEQYSDGWHLNVSKLEVNKEYGWIAEELKKGGKR